MGVQQPGADASNTTATAAAAGSAHSNSSSSGESDDTEPYVVALAVVLPVLTVVFGAALFAIRRAVRVSKQQHSNLSSSHSPGRTGGGCAAPLHSSGAEGAA
jgi:hypothetical protein